MQFQFCQIQDELNFFSKNPKGGKISYFINSAQNGLTTDSARDIIVDARVRLESVVPSKLDFMIQHTYQRKCSNTLAATNDWINRFAKGVKLATFIEKRKKLDENYLHKPTVSNVFQSFQLEGLTTGRGKTILFFRFVKNRFVNWRRNCHSIGLDLVPLCYCALEEQIADKKENKVIERKVIWLSFFLFFLFQQTFLLSKLFFPFASGSVK